MDQQPPNHKVKERDPMPTYSQDDAPHTRRNSVHAGSGKSPVTARKEPQRPLVTDSPWRSQGGTHRIPFSPGRPPIDSLSPSPPPLFEKAPELTDDEIRSKIMSIMRELDLTGQYAWCYETADEDPPITPTSLAELDMQRIINNPKLRHDVNFDRELHFRPNLDGSKGRQKMQQSDQYWKSLEAELCTHNLALMRVLSSPGDEAYWARISKGALVRLPKIFTAVRDILKTLVPDYDQKAVKDRLDVEHIMQQIQNGVCDLIDLGKWLAKVLKNHCAPMRDGLVDNMQKEIDQGARDNDPKRLVSGLRQLMNILEAMKLDVANHQIRHMRPLLIEDTINFQRRYNAHRMGIGKISQEDAKRWLEDNMQPLGCESSKLSAITRGLIQDLIYNDGSSFCPPTFYLDSDRLRALRIELHCKVYHAICRDVLRELAASSRISPADLDRACEALQSSVTAIVGVHGKFADRVENIAAEIVRVLLVAEGRHPPFDVDLQLLVEQSLGNFLSRDCSAFRQNAKIVAETLIPKVQSRVRDNVRLSALDLQDLLVPQVASQRNSMGFGAICEPLPGNDLTAQDPDEDIIGRFTHIIALHWQVWSELVYLVEEKEEDAASDNGSESTVVQSQQGSPTIPVATAVYAPGKKWLPVSVTVTDVPSGLPTPSPSPAPQSEEESPEQGGEESLDSQQQQPA